MTTNNDEFGNLILAAEDCPPERFAELHRFSAGDEKLIRKLISHGPVLLRGGRGSGKSALFMEAARRLEGNANTFGVYLSLRHLELIRSESAEYQSFLCKLLIQKIQNKHAQFNCEPNVSSVQRALAVLSRFLQKRIILFFDDAAHIGREASLGDFFDIFRTISSNTVSCKAAIYPGVTRFGTRFDVYNDATVLELSRSEEISGFKELFAEVMLARFGSELTEEMFDKQSRELVAAFLGQAVLGNMRAFVYACNLLPDQLISGKIGLTSLTKTLIELATNHYWPLLEELAPKLGVYEPMVEPAKEVAEHLFSKCSEQDGKRFAVVLRDITEKMAKPFEILEYAGFIARRQVSRAMKSGGRGARFSLNLCNLLEVTSGARLTDELFQKWSEVRQDPVEFHKGSELVGIPLPILADEQELGVLDKPVRSLAKSNAYPYGLTEAKIELLEEAQIETVRQLASATDDQLLALQTVGPAFLVRFRNVVGQAIWM